MASSKKVTAKKSPSAPPKRNARKSKRGSAAGPAPAPAATPPASSAAPSPVPRDLRSFDVNTSLAFSEQELIAKGLAFGLFFDLSKLTEEQRTQLWNFVNDVKCMAVFCAIASSHDRP